MIRPYSPSASAKMSIRIIATNTACCFPYARTLVSPTMPIAKPAASEDRP